MTVADNIAAIAAAKREIVTAIVGKGGTLASDPPISVIAPAITALPEGGSGGGGDWDGAIQVLAGTTSSKLVSTPESLIIDFDNLPVEVGGNSNRWPQYWPIVWVRNGKNITLGTNAFYGCSALTSVDGLAGVTGSISTQAFQNCSALTEMWTAATSLTSPSATSGQFRGCTNLTQIHFTAPVMCVIGGTTDYNGLPASFRECPANIIVPDNLLADYKANARWALMDTAGRLWSETKWSRR